ncbi:MAG: glycosyltransferase, partial [Candidatus Hydrothermarchaeales archaeon]
VASKKGRTVQMNTGAGRARGDILFFLHADCLPEKKAFLEVEEIMKNPKVVGGALKYDLDEDSLLYRTQVFWSNLRARLTGIHLGDHGIFVRRFIFDRIGGFPPIPLMEDVALCKRLKKEGKLVQTRSRITSSSRRFKTHGFVKTVLLMWTNRFLFFLGVSPETLERFYGDAR